jgi:hypothetical protein
VADLTMNVRLYVDGPVSAKVIAGGLSPYAVISLGSESDSAVLFPDAEALDSLIAEAIRCRDEIAAGAGRG